ncbi:adenosylcobinamide amidohydrolase [Halohasta salina]|uniref:adenosylcobinamide amidohydrolase n=1 Tax=Halohasta salina TaxID=2961621 RepID=UPI002AA29AE2|nr:adenosylcobinamide amidohydrolase [Halohasta salina]
MTDRILQPTVRSNVCQLRTPTLEWLSTGFDGGSHHAAAAYNITVPEGWTETDLRGYADGRLAEAGFDTPGPVLLTGVDQRHARRASLDPVEVVVTAGVSNPSTLPAARRPETYPADPDETFRPGTINIIATTKRDLSAGALANLVAVVTEAKTATLLRLTGFSGTTSDAVIVGSDPSGEPARFSGASTAVGRAARACVRDALTAALASRYENEVLPESVVEATYGCATTVEATVSEL